MREIVFDTETTGLDPVQGHRLVEIGCVELLNRFPTGTDIPRYLNPERDMPAEAFAVHGLVARVPQGQAAASPRSRTNSSASSATRRWSRITAMFDLGFINAELERASKPVFGRDRMVDTLMLARRKHPGGSNRLDDLCARYWIDNSRRTKHGALLDAELLAEVYVELIGARQAMLGLADDEAHASTAARPGRRACGRRRSRRA